MCQSLHMYFSFKRSAPVTQNDIGHVAMSPSAMTATQKWHVAAFNTFQKWHALKVSPQARLYCLHHERWERVNNIEWTHLHRETPKSNDNSSLRSTRQHKYSIPINSNISQWVSAKTHGYPNILKQPGLLQRSGRAAARSGETWWWFQIKVRILYGFPAFSQLSLCNVHFTAFGIHWLLKKERY